jgi:hypothetical protein
LKKKIISNIEEGVVKQGHCLFGAWRTIDEEEKNVFLLGKDKARKKKERFKPKWKSKRLNVKKEERRPSYQGRISGRILSS